MASPQRWRPWSAMALGGSCGCVWAWCGRSTWRPPCPPLRQPLGALAAGPARRPGPAQGRSLAPGACRGPRCGRLERQWGPMRPVWRPVRGPFRWRVGRGNGLCGRDGLHGWHQFGERWFGVAGCCPGLLSWRPNRDRGFRQLPLLPLCGGFPRASLGDGGEGAGPAVVAVVLLGGAIGV